MIDLSGKYFVVTGGTQGLGEATAVLLAQRGAAGITICGRNEDNGTRVAKALEEAGTQALFVRADLTAVDDCANVIARHDERFGAVHGLVNAAASTARGTVTETTAAEWDFMFSLNLRAPFLLMRDVVNLMIRDGIEGSIVNIGSVSGHGGQDFLCAYSTSKGALMTLTKNAAHSLRNERIRVNCLNIGWMATEGEHSIQTEFHGAPADWLEKADASQPFGRILRPEDVAKLTAYLLSDDSALMTGSCIDYDQIVVGARD
jgi:NAD(P)-dependent dehydrogenase (short-subunit alcohol dehydrogenase family)